MGISIENLCVTYGGGTRVIDGMTLDDLFLQRHPGHQPVDGSPLSHASPVTLPRTIAD